MSKVRVVMAEMEGSDEAVLGAIRSFVGEQVAAPPPMAPEEIEAPAAAPVRALPAPPVARRAKAGRAAAVPAVPAAPAVEDGPVVEAIVAALRKGPRTSGEVIQLSGYSSGSVYPALKKLRDAGRVDMVGDESDGQRRNRLVERGSGEGKRS